MIIGTVQWSSLYPWSHSYEFCEDPGMTLHHRDSRYRIAENFRGLKVS